MKIYISHAGHYDYENELYLPIKSSPMYQQHEFFLPHESQNIDIAMRDILGSLDIVVAEVSYPSTGQGIEIGYAAATRIPIICFFKDGSSPSSSLRFVTKNVFKYRTSDELLDKLGSELEKIL